MIGDAGFSRLEKSTAEVARCISGQKMRAECDVWTKVGYVLGSEQGMWSGTGLGLMPDCPSLKDQGRGLDDNDSRGF